MKVTQLISFTSPSPGLYVKMHKYQELAFKTSAVHTVLPVCDIKNWQGNLQLSKDSKWSYIKNAIHNV
jgi:hypothetical protein